MTFNSINKTRLFLLAFLLAAIIGPAGTALAQESPQTEQARERLQQVKDRLQLTPEQTEQVRPIFVDELQQLKAIRDKHTSDDSTPKRREKLKMAREMKEMQKAADDKLKKILSAQQMDQLKQIREEWRQQMRDRQSQRQQQ